MPNKAELLKATFPHMRSTKRWRLDVYHRYNTLRLLRNRVFHFERIWNNRHLERNHDELLEAISWISPELRNAISRIDRFPDVFANGRGRIEADVSKQLGIS